LKLLIYGINYAPELTGIGKYTGEMGPWFADVGADVRVVTSPPYYPNWAMSCGYTNRYQREVIGDVDVIRCPLYVPKIPGTLSRLIHLVSFSVTSFFVMLRQIFWKPDVIVVIAPSLMCAPTALFVAQCCAAKTVLHIQDFEIDAMFGLQMMKSARGRRVKIAAACERWLLQRFDQVSTISYSMMRLAINKGVDASQVLFTPNWVDTTFVSPDISGARFREKFGFTDAQKVVLYSGNIGRKQGLSVVLEAAAFYEHDANVQFVIVGNGSHKAELAQQAKRLELTNVQFRDLVPYEDLPELLSMADVHLVVQQKGAADVVLPSKLTSILSLGGYALITAEQGTELAILVESYPGIAGLVEPENLAAFVEGLDLLLALESRAVNHVARDYAVNNLSKDAVLKTFFSHLTTLGGFQEVTKPS
jgi:colanic acid biosynthesis glycosyl transferase WcaI